MVNELVQELHPNIRCGLEEAFEDSYRNTIDYGTSYAPLQIAQMLIEQAAELVRETVKETPLEGQSEAYLVPQLEKAAHKETRWMGSNECNLDYLIDLFAEVSEGE